MRSHHRLLPLLAPLVLAAIAVAGAIRPAAAEQPAPYDPFVIPAAKFHAEVKSIALAPLDVSADPKAFSPLRAEAETRFAEAVAKQGFRVVPAQEYRRIWAALAGRLGGVYDPVTGDPIADKWKACTDLVARELAREHGVDAIARPAFSRGSLRWGGSGFSGEAMALGEPITMPVPALPGSLHWPFFGKKAEELSRLWKSCGPLAVASSHTLAS